jgi:carbon starvation protein
MLAEAFVALIALVTVAICTSEQLAGLKPGKIYGNGIGEFMTLLIGPEHRRFAITFGAMAFSTFVFDTLDVATRLGRYLVQELLGWRGTAGAVVGTLATIAPAALFLFYGGEGSYLKFWALFGASNQLLAALTLMSIAVWLKREGKSTTFVVLPLAFVLVITTWALVEIARASFRASTGVDVAFSNGVVAVTLIALAAFLAARAATQLRGASPRAQSAA